jgi:hypothetical protein
VVIPPWLLKSLLGSTVLLSEEGVLLVI